MAVFTGVLNKEGSAYSDVLQALDLANEVGYNKYTDIFGYSGNINQKNGEGNIGKIVKKSDLLMEETNPSHAVVGYASSIHDFKETPRYDLNPFRQAVGVGRVWTKKEETPVINRTIDPFLEGFGERIDHLKENSFDDYVEAALDIPKKFYGGFAAMLLTNTDEPAQSCLMAFNDRNSTVKLYAGKKDGKVCFTTDPIVMDYLDYDYKRLPGGTVVIADTKGNYKEKKYAKSKEMPCAVNIMHRCSPNVVEEVRGKKIRVQKIRDKVAERTGKDCKDMGVDFFTEIPESAKHYAYYFAKGSGLDYRSCIMKLDTAKSLISKTERQKLPIFSTIGSDEEEDDSKNIIIIDHNYMKREVKPVISKMKKYGAGDIHLRVASNPFRHQCPYNLIKIGEVETKKGRPKLNEEIAEECGADTFDFTPVQYWESVMGQKLCKACMTGDNGLSKENQKFIKYINKEI